LFRAAGAAVIERGAGPCQHGMPDLYIGAKAIAGPQRICF
jgi:hypothetical protein